MVDIENKRLSGVRKATREHLMRATPFAVRLAEAIPAVYAALASSLSNFENDVWGDCDTAEEMQNINTAWGYVVPNADLSAFLRAHGLANGAFSPDVLNLMASVGITSGGFNYKDGPYSVVAPSDVAAMSSAIYSGAASGAVPSPVKLDVDGSQLQSKVDLSLPFSIVTGLVKTGSVDHDTNAPGYGSMGDLLALLNSKYNARAVLPSNVDPVSLGFIHYTWGQYQLMDALSLSNFADTGYVRSPSSIRTPAPIPTPTPTPTPCPRLRAAIANDPELARELAKLSRLHLS